MNLFPVYPLLPFAPVSASGSWLFDELGNKYLDLYGGHAVISIGHGHPHYVAAIRSQIDKIGFFSNSVQNPLQEKLAQLLGEVSDTREYQLFLSNSGAEANENALKLASFHTGRDKILSIKGGFHGRTSGAVAVTDNPKIVSPFNAHHKVRFVALNDTESAVKELNTGEYAAVIIEPIQGVSGIFEASTDFLHNLQESCAKNGSLLIADEVQCGYGRSGKFFAFQHANIQPDIITTAKGMGNGFPVGGTLIHPKIKASFGLLGTTFGGSHLACAAMIAVLEVIQNENILNNVQEVSAFAQTELQKIEEIKEIRGKGLMLGFDFDFPIKDLRSQLALEDRILVGSSAKAETMRLLPPLNVTNEEIEIFTNTLKKRLKLNYA